MDQYVLAWADNGRGSIITPGVVEASGAHSVRAFYRLFHLSRRRLGIPLVVADHTLAFHTLVDLRWETIEAIVAAIVDGHDVPAASHAEVTAVISAIEYLVIDGALPVSSLLELLHTARQRLMVSSTGSIQSLLPVSQLTPQSRWYLRKRKKT